ncbi:hypothetical protein [Methanooceanicella nereidis]|nr:hypothetical protein [Methanocella sp. CWC-04]
MIIASIAVSGCILYQADSSKDIFNGMPDQTPTPDATVSPLPENEKISAPNPGATLSPSIIPPAVEPQAMMTAVEPYHCVFKWTYEKIRWTFNAEISKEALDLYRNKPHNRTTNYANYALSEEDRGFLNEMIGSICESGKNNGYGEYDNLMNIVTFVQSLPYASDKVTTGYEEYPRYPVETLADNGGDCEDTCILAAALLHEMGYDVVFIKLPDHMAIGIRLQEDREGTRFEYEGSYYYYLETTGENWGIGQVPDEYKGVRAEIYPLVKSPDVGMSFIAERSGSDSDFVYFTVRCSIKNAGPGDANGLKVHVMAMAVNKGDNYIWPPDQEIYPGNVPEGSSVEVEAEIKVPKNEASMIKCVLSGENIENKEMTTEIFTV